MSLVQFASLRNPNKNAFVLNADKFKQYVDHFNKMER